MPSPDTLPAGYTATESGLLLPTQLRASTFSGTTTSDANPIVAWLRGNNWSGGRSTAGVSVSPQSSLSLAAYYACLNVIAQDCAKLPFPVLRRDGSGRVKAPDHWLWPFLNEAMNPDMTAYTAREVITFHAAGWGNGYGYVVRDQTMSRTEGQVREIYPIHPSRVHIERDETGDILYRVYPGYTIQANEVPDSIPAEDMLHIRGLGADGLCGYSVASLAAESLGLSIAAQMFGASFFGNSARLGGILEHPGQLSDVALRHLKESFAEQYGGPANTGKPAILEEGMTWKMLGIPPNEAQFLETRQFQVREICRWFRMQPHKVGDLTDAHHTNIESQNIEHVTDTMLPWYIRWEQEINRKLLKDTPYYVKHDTRGLLRGDSQMRAEYYQKLFMVGAYSPNQILELEDMEPYEGGDERYLQIQYAPVAKIADGTARQPRQAPRQTSRPISVNDTEDTEDVEDAAEAIARAELLAALALDATHTNGHGKPRREPAHGQ